MPLSRSALAYLPVRCRRHARISHICEPRRISLKEHLHRGTAPSPRTQRPHAGMIIAIDGPAASGKGTLAKRLAGHYRLRHLDSGLIYRAVAQAMLEAAQRLDDVAAAVAAARTLDPARFDEPALK